MDKAHKFWPCPQHVAWPSLCVNCACTLPEPSLYGHSAYMNPSTCIFPAVNAFPGFPTLATPVLKTDQTNEVKGFFQIPKSDPCLKQTHAGGAIQNANPPPLQKKFLIVDQSGNNTRLFYSPVFPLVQSPIVTTTQFAQAYDVIEEGQATNVGKKHLPNYSLPEESYKEHLVNEESEMHEDTEEINALLYSDDYDSGSDDDDDEVTSTGHSPFAAKRTYLVREQFEDTKEEVASSDWPNKRHKLIDGGYKEFPLPVDSASSVRLNETYDEYVSDADNSLVGDIQLKKDKIRESLRVLENLTPGAKGKHPMLVIDETIDYLKSLMSQTGILGMKYY